MKKSLFASVSAGAIALAGAVSAQEITLQFWDNQQTESGLSQFQQEAVDRFMAENPDIAVEVTTIPYPEYQQRLLTAGNQQLRAVSERAVTLAVQRHRHLRHLGYLRYPLGGGLRCRRPLRHRADRSAGGRRPADRRSTIARRHFVQTQGEADATS